METNNVNLGGGRGLVASFRPLSGSIGYAISVNTEHMGLHDGKGNERLMPLPFTTEIPSLVVDESKQSKEIYAKYVRE